MGGGVIKQLILQAQQTVCVPPHNSCGSRFRKTAVGLCPLCGFISTTFGAGDICYAKSYILPQTSHTFAALVFTYSLVCLIYYNCISYKELSQSYLLFIMFCYALLLSKIGVIFDNIIIILSIIAYNNHVIFLFNKPFSVIRASSQ